ATHVYTFCSPFVPCSSAKCKMSLKTGMHILQVRNCDTLADLLCSGGVSSSWTPRQEPENKQVMVKFRLTLLE
ncbi:hypothetical protein FD754_024063, partial [Muntiacus muntjak]